MVDGRTFKRYCLGYGSAAVAGSLLCPVAAPVLLAGAGLRALRAGANAHAGHLDAALAQQTIAKA